MRLVDADKMNEKLMGIVDTNTDKKDPYQVYAANVARVFMRFVDSFETVRVQLKPETAEESRARLEKKYPDMRLGKMADEEFHDWMEALKCGAFRY